MRPSSQRSVRRGRTAAGSGKTAGGFTIVETVLAMTLTLLLCISTLGAILEMQFSSKRVADYAGAMAVAEAKVQDIRSVYYNPPNWPFTTGTVYVTNQNSISLNQAGTTFQIPGTVISKIDYQGSLGHLVTVTATFNVSRKPVTATLQTIVNSYSGGQQ
jgi:type II secretory pathway pseudopilin PulG